MEKKLLFLFLFIFVLGSFNIQAQTTQAAQPAQKTWLERLSERIQEFISGATKTTDSALQENMNKAKEKVKTTIDNLTPEQKQTLAQFKNGLTIMLNALSSNIGQIAGSIGSRIAGVQLQGTAATIYSNVKDAVINATTPEQRAKVMEFIEEIKKMIPEPTQPVRLAPTEKPVPLTGATTTQQLPATTPVTKPAQTTPATTPVATPTAPATPAVSAPAAAPTTTPTTTPVTK